jgi:hypothetical protein
MRMKGKPSSSTPRPVTEIERSQVSISLFDLFDTLTYRLIRDAAWLDGAMDEAKKLLRLLGEAALGPPGFETVAAIKQLNNLAQLEELIRRVRAAGSWQELLGQALSPRRGRPRQFP